MIFGQDRNELRKMYLDAWQKQSEGLPLSPLESQIATVVAEHPEYHEMLSSNNLDKDFTPEQGGSNPFLHMGLHLAIREQTSTDRPAGIAAIHRQLSEKAGNSHDAKHRMIDALAETLWESQRNNVAPDEQKYVERLKRL